MPQLLTLLPITLSSGTAAQEFRAIHSPIRVSILCPSFCPFSCLMRVWITCLFRQPAQGGSSGQGRASGPALLCQGLFDSTVTSRQKFQVLGLGAAHPPRTPEHLAELDLNFRSPLSSFLQFLLFLHPFSLSLPTVPRVLPRPCQAQGWSACPSLKGKCYLSLPPSLPLPTPSPGRGHTHLGWPGLNRPRTSLSLDQFRPDLRGRWLKYAIK